MAVRNDVVCKTYRYLRLTVVGLTVLLGVSVALQIVHDGGTLLDSISAYYYTAPRSVLVGALAGIGAALIAIKGRAGAEDTMLNYAGMLAPLVAMVPTPVAPQHAGSCGGAPSCVPPELVPGVQNNVWALLAVGAGALVVAGLTVRGQGGAARRGFVGAVALWLAVLVSFVGWQDAFLSSAHYSSAAGLFVLIVLIVVINARRAPYHVEPPLVSARTYAWAYRVIAGVMLLTAAAALVMLVLGRRGVTLPGAWRFWVETAMIVTFTAFWVVQTAQFWRIGVPDAD